MNKFKIEEVETFIKKNSECKLLEDKYIDINTQMQFKCKCGNIFITTFNKFKYKNKRQCDICGYKIRTEKLKLDIKYVKKFVDSNSRCKLISTEYLNSRTPMKFECQCGEIFETTFNSFNNQNQRQCTTCGIKIRADKRKSDLDDITMFIKDNSDCELLEDEYINVDTKMKFRCGCGEIFYTTFNNFKYFNKNKCDKCTLKSVSGENNYNWNPNITQAEREDKRLYNEYIRWRQDVYEKDNYTCQCCNQRGHGTLNVHHLDGYNWCKEKRTDINNGITLCEDCHKGFHSIYGYGNNTKEQYINYKNNIERSDENE